MLYERWREIAEERRNEPALHDVASGKRWTFGELLAAGEAAAIGPAGLAFPQGHVPEFFFILLAAWRENKTACPLEPGQGGTGVTAGRLPGDIAPPIVHLKSTSATGGAARFVAFTAEQLMADAENIVATMGLRPDWPNLGIISMAHSYGFSNLVLPLLLHGIPLILAPAPLPETVRRAAENAPAITLPAVPAMWRAWHETAAIPQNVRLAISAGAPLPAQLEREVFKSCGLKIHNFLGSSECGGIAYDTGELPRTEDALVGSAMRGVQLSLNNDGCLVVRSRAAGETYWPKKSAWLGGGIFQTSDLAEIKDGLVFLRGRLGDQINVAGRKVSPETIERALLAHPQVRECLVFGTPSRDAGRTETIVAVVASSATESALKNFLRQTLPAWQVPREWHFVDSLSPNVRGKISRAEWRKQFSPRV
jgi:acyl-coenzyme A synthetase/AMP-(fatty) acid ligase